MLFETMFWKMEQLKNILKTIKLVYAFGRYFNDGLEVGTA